MLPAVRCVTVASLGREHMKKHLCVGTRYVLRSTYLVRGYWAARYRDTRTGVTKQKTTRFKDQGKATRWLVRWLETMAGEPEPISMVTAFEKFFSHLTCREVTKRQYRGLWKNMAPHFDGLMVGDVRRSDVDEFTKARRELGNAPRTIAMHVALLRQFFRWCAARDYATRAPTAGIKVSASRNDVGRALTPEEATRLLAACASPHLRLNVSLGLLAGLRARNIAELRWSHVSPELDALHFSAADMKGKRPFSIPLHPALQALLRERRAGLRVIRPNALIVGSKLFRKAFETALKSANVDHIRIHDLRVTFGSWLGSVAPYAVVRSLLGHAVQSVTDRYTLCTWDDKVKAINGLPVLMSAGENIFRKNSEKRS